MLCTMQLLRPSQQSGGPQRRDEGLYAVEPAVSERGEEAQPRAEQAA